MRRLNIIGNRKGYFIRNLKFRYDRLNDLFYAYKEDSSVYSNVMIGEFHLEFDKEGSIVGIEILKASDILGAYGIQKKLLENIDDASMKVVVKDSLLLVFLTIHALKQEKSAAITINNLESPIMKAVAEA